MTTRQLPKDTFLAHEDTAKAVRAVLGSTPLNVAITTAVAHYALNHHPSSEQCKAVEDFVTVLREITDKTVPKPAAPQRQLNPPA
jgi:hypothetical protein